MRHSAAAIVESPREIRVRADISSAAWDEYVRSRTGASVYHLSAWAGLLERVFGHRTSYLAACDGDEIVGVLPLVLFKTPLFGRFSTSMPFVNYGGVVADSSEAARALLEAAIGATESARGAYLELRHTHRMFPELQLLSHKVEMILPLQASIDDQWRVLDRKLRNQVRKAEKAGLSVERGGIELLDDFHHVLATNMRDLGSPFHGKPFFAEILRTFPERTRLLCVRHGSVPVAASIVIWHGTDIEVPYASSLRAYNSLCPNVLLYWDMLRFSIEQRMARFDFGRSTPNEGTFNFKQQWGAQAHPLFWEYWLRGNQTLPDRSPKNSKFSAAISAWRRLPLAVTTALGPHIVRGIP
jgi:FemAB-related protein (PEP-CTERM system-associated)